MSSISRTTTSVGLPEIPAEPQDGTIAPGAEAPAAPVRRGGGAADAVEPRVDASAVRSAALRAGLETRRSDGPEGTERVITKNQERRIERLFQRLEPAIAAGIDADLARLGSGPDGAVAGALYLRAAAARTEALTSIDDPAAREAALATLAAFADHLEGIPAADLLAKATVLDLDSRVSTSDIYPLGLGFDQKKPGSGQTDDRRTHNDGLFQRFTASCGSTTLQMMLYEEDPIRAFAAHEAGVSSYDPDSLIGRFQAELLERYDGVAISRLAADTFARFKKGVGELRKNDGAKAKDLDSLRDYVTHQGPLDAGARRALAAMREASPTGFPADSDLDAIRAGQFPRKDDGLGFEELGQALNDYLAPVTGVRYEQTNPPEGFAKGQAWRHLDTVASALRKGIDVPFGISTPPHWMLLAGTKGREPSRQFLVSDPASGITAWVDEKSLVKGDFIDQQFRIGEKAKKGFIDSFYLPVEA